MFIYILFVFYAMVMTIIALYDSFSKNIRNSEFVSWSKLIWGIIPAFVYFLIYKHMNEGSHFLFEISIYIFVISVLSKIIDLLRKKIEECE